MAKYNKDFRSQVTCLPGPVKNNDTKELGKLNSEKRQERTDIFFHKKTSAYLPEPKMKLVKKNIPSNEINAPRRKSSRPEHILNPFDSQIFK